MRNRPKFRYSSQRPTVSNHTPMPQKPKKARKEKTVRTLTAICITIIIKVTATRPNTELGEFRNKLAAALCIHKDDEISSKKAKEASEMEIPKLAYTADKEETEISHVTIE